MIGKGKGDGNVSLQFSAGDAFRVLLWLFFNFSALIQKGTSYNSSIKPDRETKTKKGKRERRERNKTWG